MRRSAHLVLVTTAFAAACLVAASRTAPQRPRVRLAKIVSPRDAASGLPTGKRMH